MNVQQTFQFADDFAKSLCQEHQQTGKFAVHLCPAYSVYSTEKRCDADLIRVDPHDPCHRRSIFILT